MTSSLSSRMMLIAFTFVFIVAPLTAPFSLWWAFWVAFFGGWGFTLLGAAVWVVEEIIEMIRKDRQR